MFTNLLRNVMHAGDYQFEAEVIMQKACYNRKRRVLRDKVHIFVSIQSLQSSASPHDHPFQPEG
jgi:hypothetical protein